jgi:ATP-dependent DNA helicase DinG
MFLETFELVFFNIGLCVSKVEQCYHTTADYGPCMSNEGFGGRGCKYRTFEDDYRVDNKDTREENVFIDDDIVNYYQIKYSQWSHPGNLKKELRVWRPCAYYDQLNIALVSSHAIFNYSMFLSLLTYRIKNPLPTRNLLILDVVLTHIGNKFTYTHRLHFCQEVYIL